MRPTDFISIGDLAERTGVSVSAIRFYETRGLLQSLRSSGNQRKFLRSDIRRVSFVLIAQQFGFSIEEIKTELDRLPQGRNPTKRDWTRISNHFREHLNDKIEALTNLREKLDGCIGCGCLSLAKCRLYNPDDKARLKGTGPRYLLGDIPDVG